MQRGLQFAIATILIALVAMPQADARGGGGGGFNGGFSGMHGGFPWRCPHRTARFTYSDGFGLYLPNLFVASLPSKCDRNLCDCD